MGAKYQHTSYSALDATYTATRPCNYSYFIYAYLFELSMGLVPPFSHWFPLFQFVIVVLMLPLSSAFLS